MQILYNEAKKTFVLLFHCDLSSFQYPAVGVANAESITGPYQWVHVFKPDGQDSYDMGVYQEPDGRAYLVRSVGNAFLGISQLNDEYTNTTGLCSTTIRVSANYGPHLLNPWDTSSDRMHGRFSRPSLVVAGVIITTNGIYNHITPPLCIW